MSSIAWLSTKQEGGKILCEACAEACRLEEGEFGKCGVRRVENAELQLLSYGIAAAVTIDTAEQLPLYHHEPDSRILSIGTVGCNFGCRFCLNYDLSQYPKENHTRIDGRPLTPAQVVDLAIRYECDAIAYTYTNPAIYFEYAYDIAKMARHAGIKNLYVSAGYETTKAIDLIAPLVDRMVIDLKGFNEPFYQEICGASLAPVLDTIRYAHSKEIDLEITTTLIPGHNDSDGEIDNMASFIAALDPQIPWHVLAFHPIYRMLDVPPTPAETLKRAVAIGEECGLAHVRVRNVPENPLDSTCHGCA